jgi:Flp pilus assembly protein TadD
VDLGPATPLGHADEPFPFETPEPESRPRRDTAVPLPADPFGAAVGRAAQPPSDDDPFAAAAAPATSAAAPSDPFADPGMAQPFEVTASPEPAASASAARPAPALAPAGGTGAGTAAEPGLGALGAKESEELEMLFDDAAVRPAAAPSPARAEAPAAAGPGDGWRVRRRSGKVFGPFTEREVVDMLGNGELLGNEEVASGPADFGPIGDVPAFGAAMRRLMDAPAADPAAPAEPSLTRSLSRSLSRSLRVPALPRGEAGGVVERVRGALGQRPVQIAAVTALGVVLLALVGLAAGLTPYGVFFHSLLDRGGAVGRPGAKLLAEGRQRLAEDGYAGVRAALDLAERALRLEAKDREAKALHVQAASLLARRHGGAGPALERARGFAAELAPRAAEDVEAAKAALGLALVGGDPVAPAAVLERHLAKHPADGDALLLLGDAALARGDAAGAAALYKRLDALAPGSARSSHALGVAARRRGEAAEARSLFRAALARDAHHLASAVELGRLALAAGELQDAEAMARRVLASEAQGDAGPRERAEARAVLGLVQARRLGDDAEAGLRAAEKDLLGAVDEDPADVEARLALAGFELDRGAPDKAAAALAPVAAAAASDPRITDAQARALAGQGRVLDAMNLLDAALVRAPGDPRLLTAKGLVLAQSGKRAEAEKLWADAGARDTRAWEPHLLLGRASLARGDLEAAGRALQLAVERAPAEAEAVAGSADLLLARKDLAAAEAGYRRALALDPAEARALLGLAHVALARGDAASARASLERALRLDPGLAQAQALLGELAWKAGDLSGARKALAAAVALDPSDAWARARLGVVELDQREFDAAINDLLAASNMEMGSAEIRVWLGRALLAKNDLPPAAEQLRKAVELEPGNGRNHLLLGQVLERQNALGEAAESYRTAQARAPDLVEAWEAMGSLLASQNRCAEALKQLERAVALAPKEQRLRVAQGDCEMRLGRPEAAIALYRRALEADPRQRGLAFKIGRAAHEAGGMKDALPWYERAAREEPPEAMAWYYLGFAYKDRNQRAKSIEAFRTYLAKKRDADDRVDIEREIEDLGGKVR